MIFAFGGNVLIATSFYVVQRTCRARLAGDIAPWFVVLGYNFFIVIAGTGYLLGITQSQGIRRAGMVRRPVADRRLGRLSSWSSSAPSCGASEPHIYVANWFYLAFIVTIAVLHLGNNAAIPVSLFSPKSYIVWSGVQDAMVQWWYGHNAVGFFLTAGFLAIMYYFIPKRAERPVYSYRLSIIHFWALIFLYIWAGPHHLHYTALPDWAQTLGMTFSIMLWMPSWGGMINGLMTLSGAWDKLRTDPGAAHDGGVGRLLRHGDLRRAADVDEGGQLALALHRLDHRPRAFRRARLGRLHLVRRDLLPGAVAVEPQASSIRCKLVNWHFWISTIGIVLYISAMWVSGILQGLMWRAYTKLGFLEYSFIETVEAMHPFYRHPRARRRAVPRRRADHGLEPLANGASARGLVPAGAPALAAGGVRRSSMSLWAKHADLREELDRPRRSAC